MTVKRFDKNAWVDMFREIGLDESSMHRWHAIFEQRWPEAHGSFLEWLGVPAADAERIRHASRVEWTGA